MFGPSFLKLNSRIQIHICTVCTVHWVQYSALFLLSHAVFELVTNSDSNCSKGHIKLLPIGKC